MADRQQSPTVADIAQESQEQRLSDPFVCRL